MQQTKKPNNEKTDNSKIDPSCRVIDDLCVTLRGLNARQLPTWDHNKKKRESIKEHLQRAKELRSRMQWSDKELAHEVMLSLRGETGSIARQFSEEIQNDFQKLETELVKYFWVPKPKSQMMKEFNNLSWNDDRQMLKQYGVSLRSKLMKIFKGGTEEFNLKLRDRFIEGIKERQPEFGRSFEMLDLDGKTDFMELAAYAQSKYDTYKNNSEFIEEAKTMLSREVDEEEMANKEIETQSHNTCQYPVPYNEVHIFDENDENNPLGYGFQDEFGDENRIYNDNDDLQNGYTYNDEEIIYTRNPYNENIAEFDNRQEEIFSGEQFSDENFISEDHYSKYMNEEYECNFDSSNNDCVGQDEWDEYPESPGCEINYFKQY